MTRAMKNGVPPARLLITSWNGCSTHQHRYARHLAAGFIPAQQALLQHSGTTPDIHDFVRS
ncbi:hypothetical protein KBY96_06055 [Cyanobium sp. ATX 6A2]|uniref:hypothetical protein n=1 Tax=Cyanobium sp. ATX 6A2 TaxID=2823700 RepID=UPI0020CCA245|nr:hypothetical protein [Cyanobium sp. ATX 6A2]MCP9887498.1 hypothetical protein [Cyanobium sp. ATX 6A2]